MHWKNVSLVIAALAWHGVTAAQGLEIVENAYELRLGNVTLPGSEVGTVIFRACDTCETKSLRVGIATRYSISQGPVSLAELRDHVSDLEIGDPNSERTPVTVFYSAQTGNVTRISLHD